MSLRPSPGNEVREAPTNTIASMVVVYLTIASLSAAVATSSTPGSWVWSITTVGAVATTAIALPGLVELAYRIRAGRAVL